MFKNIIARFRALTNRQLAELIAVIVIVGMLIAILLQKCDRTGIHAQEKTTKDSIVGKVAETDSRVEAKVQQMQLVIDSLSSELATIRKAKATSDGKLTSAEREVTGLVNDLANAREKHDTVAYTQNCDSLATTAIALVGEVRHNKSLYAATVANYDLQLKIKDSVASQWQVSAAASKTALTQVSTLYDNLYKSDLKLQKKAKRRQAAMKVMAIAILVLGGYAAAK